MSGILLSINGLTKAYPGVVANSDVSFDIREGEEILAHTASDIGVAFAAGADTGHVELGVGHNPIRAVKGLDATSGDCRGGPHNECSSCDLPIGHGQILSDFEMNSEKKEIKIPNLTKGVYYILPEEGVTRPIKFIVK